MTACLLPWTAPQNGLLDTITADPSVCGSVYLDSSGRDILYTEPVQQPRQR